MPQNLSLKKLTLAQVAANQQHITLGNIFRDLCRHMASQSPNELINAYLGISKRYDYDISVGMNKFAMCSLSVADCHKLSSRWQM